jgi:hypothetical protein
MEERATIPPTPAPHDGKETEREARVDREARIAATADPLASAERKEHIRCCRVQRAVQREEMRGNALAPLRVGDERERR